MPVSWTPIKRVIYKSLFPVLSGEPPIHLLFDEDTDIWSIVGKSLEDIAEVYGSPGFVDTRGAFHFLKDPSDHWIIVRPIHTESLKYLCHIAQCRMA